MKVTAYVEERSQHSRGSSNGRFGGPDRYVAVQVVPEGVERLQTLDSRVAQKRGITIILYGEGYSRRQQTDRSMLNQARTAARELADRINSGQEEVE